MTSSPAPPLLRPPPSPPSRPPPYPARLQNHLRYRQLLPRPHPPHPPRPLLHPLPRRPRRPVLPRLLSLRRRPPALALSPRQQLHRLLRGLRCVLLRLPLNDVVLLLLFSFVLSLLLCQGFSISFEREREKHTFGLQICFSFQREVYDGGRAFNSSTSAECCDDKVWRRLPRRVFFTIVRQPSTEIRNRKL
ncbi:hypothetical protein V8G54_004434 [Vigna mungo]|uniref:Uncharacterized protein n=1 Tax=Vigna mungo TaxID=3915 RepID=A0AAQ3PCC3_VIGMU